MMEIKLEKRVKYAGDVHAELMKAGFTPKGAAELLDHVPDAKIERVSHGKFVYEPGGVVCSECGKKPMMRTDNEGYFLVWPKYCPHCGAKMDLE